MRSFIRLKVVDALSYISRKTLAKYQPFIIGVTGNIGKTTTKDYIYNFLKYKYKDDVRRSEKSQNSEIGLNLTILGEKNAWNNPFLWLNILFKNFINLGRSLVYPKILVLEVGADKPGDIKYLTRIIKPDMVVLTAFQESPTHGEFFKNIEQHINEKKVLVDKMKSDGVVIYNIDDAVMTAMANSKKQNSPDVQVFSYGFGQEADLRILEVSNLYDDEAEILGLKTRLRVNFVGHNEDLELRLVGVVGTAHVYSLSCAILVSLLNGFTKEDIYTALKDFEFTKSRMRLLDGKDGITILDDSYNSSPKALENAIETVSKILTKGKKVAILGHMAELGNNSSREHMKIGKLAVQCFDIVIFAGRNNDFFLEGARQVKTQLKNIYLAKDSAEVLEILETKKILKASDLVLVKGSQSARLEKVVVSLLVNPHDESNVCRQDAEWLRR